jgi:hypothetical protein
MTKHELVKNLDPMQVCTKTFIRDSVIDEQKFITSMSFNKKNNNA